MFNGVLLVAIIATWILKKSCETSVTKTRLFQSLNRNKLKGTDQRHKIKKAAPD